MALHNKRLQMVLLWLIAATLAARAESQVIRPDCQEYCGSVNIPYPFGTKEGCYLNETFLITCDNTSSPLKPVLWTSNIEVLDISVSGQLRIHTVVSRNCYNRDGQSNVSLYAFTILEAFRFSYTRNKFVAVGCDTYAVIQDSFENRYMTGCMSLCAGISSVTDGVCSGIGCCQIPITKELSNFNVSVESYHNHTRVWSFNPCSYSFVVDEEAYHFSIADLADLQNRRVVPTVLDWAVGYETCQEAKKNSAAYACQANSFCYDSDNGPGYRCNCSTGYNGNPYLPDGCQDVDECDDSSLNDCSEICLNTIGSYNCSCPNGYFGDGRKNGEGCQDINECENPSLNNCIHNCTNTEGSYYCLCPEGYRGDGKKGGEGCRALDGSDQLLAIKVSVGIGMGLIVLLVGSSWLYWGLKKRKLIMLKEKFFRQNGGLLLQQQLSERELSTNTSKIFTAEELKKATNNYDENRIVGRGGYGTVYKGIFPDNSIVAIKKSKMVDQSQIEQFINEVVVLSQINHRNVVKLLGCCLETEVPLLVYEYITNGTLFDHIHNEGNMSAMPWKSRLSIAVETAGVLSYLHSATSIPIIHRDVKSTNILLDDNYTAKVSDFGASRLVPLDETQISTMVQGTLGYLDPEYLHTSQLTEKSDVYSFGVVLVELLTGKKPLCFNRPEEERSLAMYFLASLKANRLFQVLEGRIVQEGNTDQLKEVANLAKRCLRVKGEERPTMKEVAMELEGLRMMEKHTWVNVELNSEEREYLLSEQSDAYSYGGSGDRTTGYDSMKDQVLISAGDGR